ncbi:MAG TPA: BON domain-containing protein [Thermomicrobiaceae bacterium]|nr:BON domain-containing protein [Thermomicrobiaceae bacterium]
MTTTWRTDTDIQADVFDEFDWDPEVEVTDVGVEVDDAVVTLTGTVNSYAIKWAAERAALRVAGVRAVANDIVVKPRGFEPRSDAEIARAVADALSWSFDVPAGRIQATVEPSGNVVLEGTVDWQHQRKAAERVVRPVAGVTSVVNRIRIVQPTIASDAIRAGIEQAFVRDATVDAGRVQVQVEAGTVHLTGTVRSTAEREAAEQVAWRSRGVTDVTNEIHVAP